MSQRGTTELAAALGGRRALLFVNFHHVREANPPEFPRLHHRTLTQLREQIRVLSGSFEFATARQAREIVQGRCRLEADLCVLTFDDGLRDHYDYVAPLLAELGLTGIFCVNTGPWEDERLLSVHMAHLLSARYSYTELAPDFEAAAAACGLPHRMDDVSAASADAVYRYDDSATRRVKYFLNILIPQAVRADVVRRVFSRRVGSESECVEMHYLRPGMVRELRDAGNEIGLHSHRHLNLASETPDERRSDLATNHRLLCEALGADAGELRWISYPYGSPLSYDEQVVGDARAVGCDTGLTMRRGLNILPDVAPMLLKRVDTNDVVGGKSPLRWSQLAA